jgi:hypothetical protein
MNHLTIYILLKYYRLARICDARYEIKSSKSSYYLQDLNINDSIHLKDLEISKYKRESKTRMPIKCCCLFFVNCGLFNWVPVKCGLNLFIMNHLTIYILLKYYRLARICDARYEIKSSKSSYYIFLSLVEIYRTFRK